MDIISDVTVGSYIVLQNDKVIAFCESYEEAEEIRNKEIVRDQLQLILKKRLLKKLLRSGKGLETDQYIIAEVKYL